MNVRQALTHSAAALQRPFTLVPQVSRTAQGSFLQD